MNEKIVSLRKSKGLSQEELAEQLHVSRQAVSRWEVGTALPDASNILQLSNLFHVSADYLLKDAWENENGGGESLPKTHKGMLVLGACLSAVGFLGNFIVYILSRCVKVYAPLTYFDADINRYRYVYDGILRISYRYFLLEYKLKPLVVILWMMSVIGILLVLYHLPVIHKKIQAFIHSPRYK